MKIKTTLTVILLSSLSLFLAFAFLMTLYLSEREFMGTKMLSVVRFSSDNEEVEQIGEMKLESTADFLILELDQQSCRIQKPEGLIGGYHGGPYFCDNEIPWAIYLGNHYDTIGFNEITDLTIQTDQRSFRYTNVFLLALNKDAKSADSLRKQDCVRAFKRLAPTFNEQLDRK